MKQRCYNPRAISFPNYGARGITVCREWRESFAAFLRDMGERPAGMTLDRIDNDKGYSKANCRWATGAQQRRSSRVRGERVNTARLTAALVREARRRFAGGESQGSIARSLGVAQCTISKAILRQTWAHV